MAICWFLRISSFNYEVFHGNLLERRKKVWCMSRNTFSDMEGTKKSSKRSEVSNSVKNSLCSLMSNFQENLRCYNFLNKQLGKTLEK